MPNALLSFHLDWHAHQDGQATGLFQRAEVESELSQLVEFVAALKAIPAVACSSDFLANLREELMAEAFSIAIEPHGPVSDVHHAGWLPESQAR